MVVLSVLVEGLCYLRRACIYGVKAKGWTQIVRFVILV